MIWRPSFGRDLLALCALSFGAWGGATAFADSASSNAIPTVIVVVGAPGEEEFATRFNDWGAQWEKAARTGGAKWIPIGFGKDAQTNEAEQLTQALKSETKTGLAELWVVLLGHGTFDGKEAKFNLRGPDLSSVDLGKILEPFQRPTAVVAAFAASAPFLNKLSGRGRVVITSTRSGHEQNYSRFGEYISRAIADPEADLDKDGQTSLLEAYLMAARRLTEFYETEGRLATEHPLLDDNGDGLGTPPDWFRGVRAVKKAKEGGQLDGLRAHQFQLVRNDVEQSLSPEARAKRDELELALGKLRESKTTVNEDEYYQKLEAIFVEITRLYDSVSATNRAAGPR
jgi:hypothetical protein